MRKIILILLLLLSLSFVHGKTYKIVSVVDGDTVKVFLDKKLTTVRLAGIDAPESNTLRYGHTECGGVLSKTFLTRFLSNKSVSIKQIGKDKYDRTIAYLYHNKTNINKMLVSSGWAKSYGNTFTSIETLARDSRIGVWKFCK